MAVQATVRFGLPPGDGRENAAARANVRERAGEHVRERGDDDLLQDDDRRAFLAVVEPIADGALQLHQSEWSGNN